MAVESDAWVIVSGSAGALGSVITRHFSQQGRRVLALDKIVGAAALPGVMSRAADLLSEGEVRDALVGSISAGEKISLLVNAVGQIANEPVLTLRGGKFTTHNVANWRSVVEANLTAPFIVAAQVAARMARAGSGSIVNFSSIASEGNPGQAAYSAAKAGIEGLTRTMAVELGPLGIRVNAVALGFIDAPTTRSAVSAQRLQQYLEKTPVGRLGHVDDVIGAIEFLAANSFANGTIVRLDGGLRL